MTVPQPSFFVDYPCDRHCQVEVDVADAHLRYTLGQMLRAAEVQHRKLHEPSAEPTPVHDRVRAEFRAGF
ncbi:hypothetical protein [Actinoplanes rectilineatus]|uniref:hypothetical protein n=1 Tax=Actinoplanes rectilineatus TaxID=113571 RepID=UPI0005F281E2|nr:hypothetical protein [Actinoplanes rectilineatus]